MLSLQLSSAIRNANVVAELQATQQELKMRVEELDAFGHTIAHDLKSPLGNISLRSQMFGMKYGEQVPADALTMVAAIGQSAGMMTRMIDQLLMLAKLRHADKQLVQVKVRPTIDAALLRFSHQIEQHVIRVEVADVPDACGQAQWVEEIFANLISNAIKYMGEDNPAPSITITGVAQADAVRYEVRDTGVGIKAEDQGRLFEMFARVHEIPGIEGLGLGLSIVQRIIRKMRGEIGVESTYGEGTTFWFTLPSTNSCPAPSPGQEDHG
jgi:signal transduction histidine kinase